MPGHSYLRFNDLTAVLDCIHSGSQSAAEHLTAAIDLLQYERIVFVVEVGTFGASGTVDFQVKGATTSGGSYTAIPNTAITQLTVASTTSGKAIVIVDVDVSKIDNLNLFYRYIKGSLVPGTAASTGMVLVLGQARSFGPASEDNMADVAQVLNY